MKETTTATIPTTEAAVEYCPLWTVNMGNTERQWCSKECGMYNLCHQVAQQKIFDELYRPVVTVNKPLPEGTLEEKG